MCFGSCISLQLLKTYRISPSWKRASVENGNKQTNTAACTSQKIVRKDPLLGYLSVYSLGNRALNNFTFVLKRSQRSDTPL